MLLNSVVLAVPALLVIGTATSPVRSYLRRAPKGYITEGATYSRINTTLTETVEGARTVEALGLSGPAGRPGRRRHRGLGAGRALHDVAAQPAVRGHRRRLQHPAGGHPASSAPGATPRAGCRSARSPPRCSTSRRWAGRSTGWSASSTGSRSGRPRPARLLGIAEVPPDREPGDGAAGRAASWSAETCASPTARATTCCTASTSSCAPASGWRSSARRARASRRSAGCCRASTGRAPARPRSAASTLVDLPLEVLRTEVALVTQEHHVFIGIRARQHRAGPRGLPRRRGAGRRCAAVGSRDWVERLPRGPRHQDRLRPAVADAGPGAAGRAGAADHRRPAHAGARRGDLADRPAHRAHARGVDERPARGPHRRRDRPPAPHRPRRRPDRGRHRRPDRRARQPRRAGRPQDGEYAALWRAWTS